MNANATATRREAARLLGAAALGLVGFLLNLRPLEVVPGTDLTPGSLPALLAAAAFGLVGGGLAGALAAAPLVARWNHPFGALVLALEAVSVGALVRRGWRPFGADLLYWLGLGLPLLALTYGGVLGVRGTTAVLLFVKHPVNGLVAALLVEGLLLVPAVRRRLGVTLPVSLGHTMARTLTLVALLPVLVLGLVEGRREWDRTVQLARTRAELVARGTAATLEQYLRLHERGLETLARELEAKPDSDAVALLAREMGQLPGFAQLYVTDAAGRIRAAWPERDAAGRPLAGQDRRDRPFVAGALRTGRPAVSGRYWSLARQRPVVAFAEPVWRGGRVVGGVVGLLDLGRLPSPPLALQDAERLRLADATGHVLLERAGAEAVRGPGLPATVALRARQPATFFFQAAPADAPPAVRVTSRWIVAVVPLQAVRWWVWVERPYRSIEQHVLRTYLDFLVLLLGAVAFALLLAQPLARWLLRPLLQLRAAAAALAAGDLGARVGALRPGAPDEVADVARDFDAMAQALAERTRELEEIDRVARALAESEDEDELLRRITDAATRLLGADGAAVVLRSEDEAAEGPALRLAPYATGALAARGGQALPDGNSAVARVAAERRGLLYRADLPFPFLGEGRDLPGLRTAVAAPLVGRTALVGALVAVRGPGKPPFGATDLQLLERLAQHAAIAIENVRLRQAAQAAAEARANFLATMSHELRTPLNAMLGHLELVEMGFHGPLTEAQRHALERARLAAQHLRGLIDEVLAFTRLEAHREVARASDTDLCALLREVHAVVEPLATAKGLRLRVRPCAGVIVATDANKVRQILLNLVGNAVKFTERGEVELWLEERPQEVAIHVRDTGPGIPPEARGRLFRPFEQLQSGLDRPHEGTGLGLYVSGRYAELLGGRIEVDSEVGRGSIFTLVLPRAPARESAPHAPASEPSTTPMP